MVSETPYRVRPCTRADALALRALRLEALRDTPDAYGTTFEESVRWSRDRWEEMAATLNYFLAESQGRAVGMVSGGRNDRHPGTLWMYAMYVTPDARGTGVAAQLVEAVSQWVLERGGAQLYLHVTSAVPRARAFYRKIGFRETGETFTMDRDPSLVLVTMVRNLDELREPTVDGVA